LSRACAPGPYSIGRLAYYDGFGHCRAATGQASPASGAAIVESAAAVAAAGSGSAEAAPQEMPRALLRLGDGRWPTREKIDLASASYNLPPVRDSRRSRAA